MRVVSARSSWKTRALKLSAPRYQLLIAAMAATSLTATAIAQSAAPSEVSRGKLPTARNTRYEIRKPATWNGILITDLDYATSADDPTHKWLEEHNYALAGIAREDVANGQPYDVGGEVTDLVNVIEMFTAKYGIPKHVIQYGRSGGGFVGLSLSQSRPDRIDGAVVACAPIPVWLMNSGFDTWRTLQTLIAPDLRVTSLPKPGTSEALKLASAWRSALTAAQKTPLGRARIALAMTLGQFPAWATMRANDPIGPEPDPLDPQALENAMFDTLVRASDVVGGTARWMFENAAGAQLSWNEGIDYAELFANGDPLYQAATRRLYREAGSTPEADLLRVNGAPRLAADPDALKWYSAPTRTFTGEIRTPVIFINNTGDLAVPIAQLAGSIELIRKKGRESLAREAVVGASGHCNFEPSEIAAAVDTLVRYLETGSWPDTSAIGMNRRAAALSGSPLARFVDYDVTKRYRYSRIWVPTPEGDAPRRK